MAVRAVMRQPIRTPAASQRSERFAPFCSISRIRAGRLTAERRLPHRPSHDNRPSRSRPARHSRADPAARSRGTHRPAPTLKAPVRRGGRADPRRIQGVPLHPGAKHEQDRVHRSPIGHPGPVTPERMRRPGRQQRLDPLPQPIRQPPTIVARDKTDRSLPRRFQQRWPVSPVGPVKPVAPVQACGTRRPSLPRRSGRSRRPSVTGRASSARLTGCTRRPCRACRAGFARTHP